MRISDFKKMEESIQQQDFSKSYKNINKVMFILSIFGHIASIFLAYFLISKILSSAITDNPILVNISSFILLAGLELLKREMFDKFSLQQIKYNTIKHKDVFPLMVVSFIMISMSFYASIKGASEFSLKSKQIDIQVNTDIKRYEDSVNLFYMNKIKEYEDKISKNDISYSNKDNEITRKSSSRSWIDRNRISDLKSQMEEIKLDNNNLIENINLLKSENKKILSDYEMKVKKDGSGKKEENKNNSFIFVIISTLIELIILAGVYFNEYYKYRTYLEMRDKIESNPMYQKWFSCNNIINIIYTDDIKINDKIPSIKTVIDLCKMNSIILLSKDVSDALKLFSSLGIIKGKSTKYFNKSKESAQEILKNYFKID